ncbi:MAG: hypothetical protein WC455_29565 [Dehalococcoidia bacterium]|jgi:hypothetical protein
MKDLETFEGRIRTYHSGNVTLEDEDMISLLNDYDEMYVRITIEILESPNPPGGG